MEWMEWFGAAGLVFFIVLSTLLVCGTALAEPDPDPATDSVLGLSTAATGDEAQGSRRTIVMLGDSLTAGGDWAPLDPGAVVVNHGVTGDGYAQLLKRLDQTIAAKPDTIFLQVGINDLAHAKTAGEIVEGHRTIWAKLKEALPEVRIIVCSLIPISEVKLKRSRPGTNRFIREINGLLASAATEEGLEFIDLYIPLSGPDQALPKGLTYDGLHLTKKGQQVWLDELVRYLGQTNSRISNSEGKNKP
jgi:lysophospholipase L1-like esterase